MGITADIILKDEVAIMEDSFRTQETIKEVMEKKLNWKVTVINNQKEAVSLADKKIHSFYILDVNMGKDREQEGLDALEKIKDVDQQAFVTVFSAYPNFKKKAANLNSNWFEEKGARIEKGVCNIATKMLEYKLKIICDLKKDITNNTNSEVGQDIVLGLIDDKIKNINEKLESIKNLDNLYSQESYFKLKPAENVNANAYEKLKLDPTWLAEYQGKYVAFVEGNLVSSSENKQELLDWLIKSEQYKDNQRFFAKIEEQPRIFDEPTSLWLDIV